MIKARRQYLMRSGFTLMELMVSVAILLAVLALIGSIFSTTSRASKQANAATNNSRQLQQVTEVLRRDLQGIKTGEAGSGVLAIAGAIIKAKPLQESSNTEAGLCRADVLMLLTERQMEPYAFKQSDTLQKVSLGAVSEVVYGHANIGKIDPTSSTGSFMGTIRMLEGQDDEAKVLNNNVPNRISDIPSIQWHLARRTLNFLDSAYESPFGSGKTAGATEPVGMGPTGVSSGWPNNGWPTSQDYLTGRWDVFGNQYNQLNWVTFPGIRVFDVRPLIPKGYYEYASNSGRSLDLGIWYAKFDEHPDFNSSYTQQQYRANNKLYCYDVTSKRWFEYAGGWKRTEGGPIPWLPGPATPDTAAQTVIATIPERFFYKNGDSRTLIDPIPPAQFAERVGPHFLSSCTGFMVEYTYDDPRELPTDSTGARYVDTFGHERPFPIRWYQVPSGQVRVWSRLEPKPALYGDERNQTDPYRWPRAIRVSMWLANPAAPRAEPTVHTMTHVFED